MPRSSPAGFFISLKIIKRVLMFVIPRLDRGPLLDSPG